MHNFDFVRYMDLIFVTFARIIIMKMNNLFWFIWHYFNRKRQFFDNFPNK